MWLYQDLEGWNFPGIRCCWGWKWEVPKSQFTKMQPVKTLSGCWRNISFSSFHSPIPLCTASMKVSFFFFKIPLSPKNWKRLTLDLSWLRKWPFSQLQSCVPDAFSSGGNKSHPPILSTSNALFKLTWQVGWEDKWLWLFPRWGAWSWMAYQKITVPFMSISVSSLQTTF